MSPLVLVADDEPDIREILAQALADDGYRVVCAVDGKHALEQVAAMHPDLIVSDIKMPRLHGLTLVERLRADGHAVPVILISTRTPPRALPGVRFIQKPFDLDDVTAAVAESLAIG